MTRLFTNRMVATSLTLVAVLLSALLALWLLRRGPAVVARDRNTSNISRDQYRAARAKWNALHVTDYEATVQVTERGTWKIGVHVDTAYGSAFAPAVQASYSHRIVRLDDAAEAVIRDPYLYEFLTVGGLFDQVDDALYCQETSCDSRDFFDPSRYVVEFDQTMGYPHSFTSINEYATVETRIENVKILK